MDPKVIEAARAAFPTTGPTITLGAVLHEGACHPEPLVTIPLATPSMTVATDHRIRMRG